MNAPPLLILSDVGEYKRHYKRNFCAERIYTSDRMRVYFKPGRFDHAFYENSQQREGFKDVFSNVRAQRMDWIRYTLENRKAMLYQGWSKRDRRYVPERRVNVMVDDFVVIVEMSLRKQELVAEFITAYEAQNSMSKIRSSPIWCKEECLKALNK